MVVAGMVVAGSTSTGTDGEDPSATGGKGSWATAGEGSSATGGAWAVVVERGAGMSAGRVVARGVLPAGRVVMVVAAVVDVEAARVDRLPGGAKCNSWPAQMV
jgi:hypothetical protein